MMNQQVDDFLRTVLAEPDMCLAGLLRGYRLTARAEGLSANTITLVEGVVGQLERFLLDHGLSTDIRDIGVEELRRFMVGLRQRPCFTQHPFTPPQQKKLSGYTVNNYFRSLRMFWSWAGREGLLKEDPFSHLRGPKVPKKVMPTFTPEQLQALVAAIDTASPEGLRDYAVVMLLIDTGIRCSELCHLQLQNIDLEEGLLKVWGKGDKERVVPIGRRVKEALWRYLQRGRPKLDLSCHSEIFLNSRGYPLTKDRVGIIIRKIGEKAGIQGVRCSPHTLRHTAAVNFIRNGGNAFALQKLLGHTTLDMTRRYCELADADIKQMHRHCSPADNMGFKRAGGRSRISQRQQ